MTNEEVMQLMTDMGLHEGGMDDWVFDNAWVMFANAVAKHTLANIDPSSFLTWQEGYEAGKQTERDACIDLVAMYGGPVDLEAAIRARGHVATNDTSQERVDKTSEIVHEPVAWVSSEELLVMRGNALGGAKDWRINVGLVKQDGDVGLYTTPPQRKPLTENEIKHLWYEACQTNLELTSQLIVHLARNIEAAHGIKVEA